MSYNLGTGFNDTYCGCFSTTTDQFSAEVLYLTQYSTVDIFGGRQPVHQSIVYMQGSQYFLFVTLTFALLGSTASCNQATPPVATSAPTATTVPSPTTAPTLEPSDSARKLTVNGVERSYLLHIPPGLDGLHPVPVVFVFHGFFQTASAISFTGFNDMADKDGILVVYPEGLDLSWNAGDCCGYASDNNVDETSFVRQILSDLETIASIDPKRIYATGFSNGAELAYRLACEMSDVFAAVAPVSEAILCQTEGPVSVIHVHGLKDTLSPYGGGGPDNAPSVEDVIATWVQLNGCNSSPQVENLENGITHTVYASCQSNTAVELYTIDSGDHAWPAKDVWPGSQIIWEFFAAHPKP